MVKLQKWSTCSLLLILFAVSTYSLKTEENNKSVKETAKYEAVPNSDTQADVTVEIIEEGTGSDEDFSQNVIEEQFSSPSILETANAGWLTVKTTLVRALNELGDSASKYEAEIKSLISMGDKMLYMGNIMSEIDPKLSDYLLETLTYTSEKLGLPEKLETIQQISETEWFKSARKFSSYGAQMLKTRVQKMLKEYLDEKELIAYRDMIEPQNPLAAESLNFILHLEPKKASGSSRVKRSFAKGPVHHDAYGHSAGYGHSTGYGHGHASVISHHGGYGGLGGHGKTVDPYLLMAGLGAATLLAYVAYRVLVTTAAPAAAAAEGGARAFNAIARPETMKFEDLNLVEKVQRAVDAGKQRYEE